MSFRIKKLIWKARIKLFFQKIIQSKPFLAIVMLSIGVSYTSAWYEFQPLWRDYQAAISRGPVVIINTAQAAAAELPPIEVAEEKAEETEREVGIFSAYNAEVGQTDADPFSMASGRRVYDGAIANNCLPFGTKVEVNGKAYTVEDRMNVRYGCDHFDIFMWSKADALKFGRKTLEYTR
jgi:3D (Asp-Asp-Asp) domain-containing protein